MAHTTKLYRTDCLRKAGWERHLEALGFATPGEYRHWCKTNGFGQALHKTEAQREQERRCATRLQKRQEAEARQHAQAVALGFPTVEEYEEWCQAHGWGVKRAKTPLEYQQEQKIRAQEQATQVLYHKAKQRYTLEQWIAAAYEGRQPWTILPTAREEKISQLFRSEAHRPHVQKAFQALLLKVYRTSLCSLEPMFPFFGSRIGNTGLDGLMQLAQQHRLWIRPLEEWKPKDRKARDLFASLARHLLARYPVPAFLDAAWFEHEGHAERHRKWFMHLGKGGSPRELELGQWLTPRELHFFLQAPRDLSIDQAVGWAQVRAAGGSPALAQTLLGTRLYNGIYLSTELPDMPFWQSVLHFLARFPEFPRAEIGNLIDYLWDIRFVERTIYDANDDFVNLGPPEPNFSLKGRTPHSMLQRMAEWQRQRTEAQKPLQAQWEPMGLKPCCLTYRDASGQESSWEFCELLSTRDLEAEGRAMRNCVATYVQSCVEGQSSLWSLRTWSQDHPTPKSVLTIEVNREGRNISQAAGKANCSLSYRPDGKRLSVATRFFHRWAKENGLVLSWRY